MNVGYVAPLFDYSGYGEAGRHDVAALMAAGVTVSANLVSYVRDKADFGSLTATMQKAIDHKQDYDIKILHTTPNVYAKYIEPDRYHIGRFFWETDKVPQEFADGLKLCDEIWTGSQANADAIKNAGVDVPVFILPQAIETEREWPEKYELPGIPEGAFVFYSIFEWTERKNPQALLNAYWREFQGNENVVLVLKTYFRDFGYVNKKRVEEEFAHFKSLCALGNYPPVFMYRELMDRKQVMRFHKTGECFVSAHRGEGWGLPQVEAMLAGNPIISTPYGGCHEYFEDGVDALLPKYEMVPVRGMGHSSSWYTRDQNWAQIDEGKLREAMRWMFEDSEKRQDIAEAGHATVVSKFNLKTVGQQMRARLEAISNNLQR